MQDFEVEIEALLFCSLEEKITLNGEESAWCVARAAT